MPRTGLSRHDVIAAAAELADETGYDALAMGQLAERLGVRTPSLYKHVTDLADVKHGIALQAMTEAGDAVRDAVAGRAGRDALAALMDAIQSYVTRHPGRYAATTAARLTGPDDPLREATARTLGAIAAALRGYGIADTDMVHAIRTVRSTIHGFAVLQAAGGFQLSADLGDTLDWMIAFMDRGLRSG